MKWLSRHKQKKFQKKRQDDFQRPVRIAQRLQLRINQLADEGVALAKAEKFEESKKVMRRMDVLTKRIRRVRDFQIRKWGY